ncbi:hypothetical protein QBK99_06940 [Corticibacterium sp. UT-5YL-CI-8]|nr:hypothetical protein [Tianweitania sp. UT-5YL-CI-8]
MFASVVAWSFSRIGQTLIVEAPRLQGLYEKLTAWLDMHGIAVAGLWAKHFNVRWVAGTMQGLSVRLGTYSLNRTAECGNVLCRLVFISGGYLSDEQNNAENNEHTASDCGAEISIAITRGQEEESHNDQNQGGQFDRATR